MLFDLRENRRKIQRKNQKLYTTNAKTCGSEKIVNAKFTKWKQEIDKRKKNNKNKKNRNKTNNDHLLNGQSFFLLIFIFHLAENQQIESSKINA